MKPYLIGIAGPSCAGKSELAYFLARVLGAPIVSLDSYYRELAHLTLEERARSNFDEPDALDRELLFEQLRSLAGGGNVDVPVYDFSRHTRATAYQMVHPGDFIIVEGLFALYWDDVRKLFGTSVFVSVPHEVCFERRLERDVRDRGRTPESVHKQYYETVLPMSERYILPTKHQAHLVLSGTAPLGESAGAVLSHVEEHCGEDAPVALLRACATVAAR